MDFGFARQLLLHWAPNEKNTVCFVERAQVGAAGDGYFGSEWGSEWGRMGRLSSRGGHPVTHSLFFIVVWV